MNFRQAPGKDPEWVSTSTAEGFSNFLFVDDRFASSTVLRRILSLARRLEYASMLIEKIEEADCKLLEEENKALRTRQPDYTGSEVWRITFWRTPKEKPSQDGLIGYAVVKRDYYKSKDPYQHIYECVIKQYRETKHNNFVHCNRDYKIHAAGAEYNLSGTIYAQQNNVTFVCAHVALRSVLACVLPAADITYAEINGLIGIDHVNRTVGYGVGLGPDDIEIVLKALNINFRKTIHEPNKNVDLPGEYQRNIYGFIESGAPALMGFELDTQLPAGKTTQPRHMIPVLGHTFNEDGWVAEAQRHYFGQNSLGYFSSESWLSTYVVHDDNFGPYLCLPRHFLQKKHFRIILGVHKYPTESDAVSIETLGFAYLIGVSSGSNPISNRWYNRFALYAKNGVLVLRTLLVQKQQYLAHLADLDCFGGVTLEQDCIDALRNKLPEHFWMVEASAQELYSSTRRKFGEVLISATTKIPSPPDLTLLIAARLPGVVYTRGAQQLEATPTKVEGHTQLFSFSSNK